MKDAKWSDLPDELAELLHALVAIDPVKGNEFRWIDKVREIEVWLDSNMEECQYEGDISGHRCAEIAQPGSIYCRKHSQTLTRYTEGVTL